jgi:NADH-quinone oxidoreductase subunit N
MYFDEPTETAPIRGSRDFRWVLSVNGLALLVLGIMPQPLMALCFNAINAL